jgi:hypothetical protein
MPQESDEPRHDPDRTERGQAMTPERLREIQERAAKVAELHKGYSKRDGPEIAAAIRKLGETK